MRVQIWYIRCIQCRWVKTPTPNGLPSEALVYRILWGTVFHFGTLWGHPPTLWRRANGGRPPRGAGPTVVPSLRSVGVVQRGGVRAWCRAMW